METLSQHLTSAYKGKTVVLVKSSKKTIIVRNIKSFISLDRLTAFTVSSPDDILINGKPQNAFASCVQVVDLNEFFQVFDSFDDYMKSL